MHLRYQMWYIVLLKEMASEPCTQKHFGLEHNVVKTTYMCHKHIIDGGLWVTGPARLHCLPLHNKVRCCRTSSMVLKAWIGPFLWRRVVQDSWHTQLYLEVQKVIPGVFEEQILWERNIKQIEWHGLEKYKCRNYPGMHATIRKSNKLHLLTLQKLNSFFYLHTYIHTYFLLCFKIVL